MESKESSPQANEGEIGGTGNANTSEESSQVLSFHPADISRCDACPRCQDVCANKCMF